MLYARAYACSARSDRRGPWTQRQVGEGGERQMSPCRKGEKGIAIPERGFVFADRTGLKKQRIHIIWQGVGSSPGSVVGWGSASPVAHRCGRGRGQRCSLLLLSDRPFPPRLGGGVGLFTKVSTNKGGVGSSGAGCEVGVPRREENGGVQG